MILIIFIINVFMNCIQKKNNLKKNILKKKRRKKKSRKKINYDIRKPTQ